MGAEIKEMFNLMLSKFDNMQNQMDKKFDDMQNQMDKKFDNMQNQIDKNTHELNEFRQELADVKQRINNMQNLLETEIRHNIKIIAEGHGAIAEKQSKFIADVDAVKGKQELIEIRLKMLESDVQELKQRVI